MKYICCQECQEPRIGRNNLTSALRQEANQHRFCLNQYIFVPSSVCISFRSQYESRVWRIRRHYSSRSRGTVYRRPSPIFVLGADGAVDLLFTGDGEAFNVGDLSNPCARAISDWCPLYFLGRTIPGERITICMGRSRYRSLHRAISRWGSMVCNYLYRRDTNLLKGFIQGNIHYRLLDPWWRRQGTSNTNEEFDIDHLLRSRGNLRRHHVHRLLRKTIIG